MAAILIEARVDACAARIDEHPGIDHTLLVDADASVTERLQERGYQMVRGTTTLHDGAQIATYHWWPSLARCAELAQNTEPGTEMHERAMRAMLASR